MNCIRSKGYTDSVVDLMVGKDKAAVAEAQKALQELAAVSINEVRAFD
jgi:hypothetical protein